MAGINDEVLLLELIAAASVAGYGIYNSDFQMLSLGVSSIAHVTQEWLRAGDNRYFPKVYDSRIALALHATGFFAERLIQPNPFSSILMLLAPMHQGKELMNRVLFNPRPRPNVVNEQYGFA